MKSNMIVLAISLITVLNGQVNNVNQVIDNAFSQHEVSLAVDPQDPNRWTP